MRTIKSLIIFAFTVYWIDAVYFNGTCLTALSRMANEMPINFG
jgi:hypothetical protein